MCPLLTASAFAAFAGTAQAQSVMCRDSTVLTGADIRASCAVHGGLPLPGHAAPAASAPSAASPSTPQAGVMPGDGRRS